MFPSFLTKLILKNVNYSISKIIFYFFELIFQMIICLNTQNYNKIE